MIFAALNHEVVNLLIERSALMKKDVEGRSGSGEHATQSLKVANSVGRHRSFQKYIAGDRQFAAGTAGVRDRYRRDKFLQNLLSFGFVPPGCRCRVGKTEANGQDDQRLSGDKRDRWTDKRSDLGSGHAGDVIESINPIGSLLIKVAVFVGEYFVKKSVDFFVHFC